MPAKNIHVISLETCFSLLGYGILRVQAKRKGDGMDGYLLHFDSPISDAHTTQHYLGVTDNLENRIERHREGRAARLTEVAKEKGIGFVLARTWENVDRGWERRMKNQNNGPRFCPICKERKKQERAARIAAYRTGG